ncbi:MAG: SRPBCC family protein [Bacteroidota bacterium]
MFQFKAEQFLPITISEAWEFFSSPNNLSIITPPEMDFKVLSKLDSKDIYNGMKIDYSVRPLFGISMHWQTEIFNVNDKYSFTDRQLKGPCKVWEHTHTFTEMKGGVMMHDVVNYQLPFWLLGNIAHSLIVKNKIENIFVYRKQVLEKIFEINNGKNLN